MTTTTPNTVNRSLMIVGASALIAVLIGTSWWAYSRQATVDELRRENTRLRSDTAVAVQRAGAARSADAKVIADLRTENARLKEAMKRAVAASTAQAMARASSVDGDPGADNPAYALARQQHAILNNLRQIAAARDQYILEHDGQPPPSYADLVGSDKYIRQLDTVNGENYAALLLQPHQPLTVVMQNGLAVTYDPDGQLTAKVVMPPDAPVDVSSVASYLGLEPRSLQYAWNSYARTHANARPAAMEELIPYFATAKEGADFKEAWDARNKAIEERRQALQSRPKS